LKYFEALSNGVTYVQRIYVGWVVSTDRKFSIIIVDGRDRVNCILNSTWSLSKWGFNFR